MFPRLHLDLLGLQLLLLVEPFLAYLFAFFHVCLLAFMFVIVCYCLLCLLTGTATGEELVSESVALSFIPPPAALLPFFVAEFFVGDLRPDVETDRVPLFFAALHACFDDGEPRI